MLSIFTVAISAADKPFETCTYSQLYVVPMVLSKTLAKDEVFCYAGSFMFGSNGTIKTKVAQANKDGSFDISDEKEGTLAVLNSITYDNEKGRQISTYYTQIRCASDSGCKVQYFALPDTFHFEYSIDTGLGFSSSMSTGQKVVLSTKKTGSLTGTVKHYLKAGSKTVQNSYNTQMVVAGLNNKDFKFESDGDVTFQPPTGPSKWLQLYTVISNTAILNKATTKGVDLSGSVTATWDNAKSTSADEEEFYIPEIEATLSTEGGVFTKENIDQTYPGDEDNGGLSAGAIAGIVIACIAAVIIIAVCVWLFACGGIKKCKKGKVEAEDAPKESSQNQKEAAPADAANP